MVVAMMKVGQVRMAVPKWIVHVWMSVRLSAVFAMMNVGMMLVMAMRVGMRDSHMPMGMLVLLGEHQPSGEQHHRQADGKAGADGLAQQREGKRRAEKRRSAEMSARPGAAQMPQGDDEEHQAETITA